MRYQPGTFLEVADLSGGRKVVLVGKDGVTFWDAVAAESVTPLVIHPVMKPVELGTLVHFVHAKGLGEAAKQVLDVLRANDDERQRDSLFVMRALWCLAAHATGDGWLAGEAQLNSAFEQAEQQERVALRVHEHAEQYITSSNA